MVKKNLLDKNIKFFGFVSQRKKFELMARAHLIVVPSTREGFGLIVPEAGTVGTPAVVYNVPGLRDVVENDITGKRVEKNYTELAKGVLELLMDDRKRTKMSIAAKRKSKSFNWDNTASDALKLFKKHAKK
jgi:glycosyltransferase involved in cell wall biosynthesis